MAQKTVNDLFQDWLIARRCVIHLNTRDFRKDLIELMNDTKQFCNDLGIEWSDSFFGELDWERINDFEE